jgi:hypothetical protein
MRRWLGVGIGRLATVVSWAAREAAPDHEGADYKTADDKEAAVDDEKAAADGLAMVASPYR